MPLSVSIRAAFRAHVPIRLAHYSTTATRSPGWDKYQRLSAVPHVSISSLVRRKYQRPWGLTYIQPKIANSQRSILRARPLLFSVSIRALGILSACTNTTCTIPDSCDTIIGLAKLSASAVQHDRIVSANTERLGFVDIALVHHTRCENYQS